ncbi:F0F1 ATP synthase subunit B family protein [Endothiovibrio diazotrophicus]
MQIDWFTFFAQIANFLLLIWLLKRFLYRPVTRAMEQREAFIAARLEEAREREASADEKALDYQRQLHELEASREEGLRQAREEAEALRRRLLEEARVELADTRKRWSRQLEEERGEHIDEIKRQIAREVCAVSRQALLALADVELERQMVTVFLGRLAEMDGTQRERIAAECRGHAVTLYTREALDETLRRRADAVIGGLTGEGAELRFATSERWQCGIELELPGRSITWTLDDYLHDLEAHLNATLTKTAN